MNAEQPSFNQVTNQFSAGRKKATVLVERSGQKISTGQYAGERTSKGSYIVELTTSGGEPGYREVSGVALSDGKQAELAEALAGKSLHSDEVTDAQELVVETRMDVERLQRIVGAELQHSVNVAEKTIGDLTGIPDNDPQYFHTARDNGLTTLDGAVRRALSGESVMVTNELSHAVAMLRQASDQLALGVQGDIINDRADEIRRASYNVDDAARDFFAEADPSQEGVRAELMGQARTLQVEISSLLHENVTHYVDRINYDEKRFDDLLSGITTKLEYVQELNEQNTSGLYTDVQELIGLTETSRQARNKLGYELAGNEDSKGLADYTQELRALAEQLAQL